MGVDVGQDMGKVSVYGMGIMLFFTLLTLISHQFISIFLFSFIAGFGGGLTQAAVAVALARTQRYERAFAIFTSFQFFYPGIGAYFLPRLLQSASSSLLHGFNGMQWGQALLIFSSLLMAPVIGIFRRSMSATDPASDSISHTPENTMEIKTLLTLPAILSNVGICIYGGSNGAIFAYSEGIGRLAHLDVYTVGDIVAYANFAAGFAAIGVAWLDNRIGHYTPLITGIAIQFLSAIILYAFVSEAGYVVGMFVFTISWALVFPIFLVFNPNLIHPVRS
ncbi:MFS transporter [Daeguia caeni]|uniref:MFS transporter n=1 Tax=Daeguia caeni TaxID=439612 RepID=A0ABV9H7E6_9HYPH